MIITANRLYGFSIIDDIAPCEHLHSFRQNPFVVIKSQSLDLPSEQPLGQDLQKIPGIVLQGHTSEKKETLPEIQSWESGYLLSPFDPLRGNTTNPFLPA